MPAKRTQHQLVDLEINKLSGVDHPAHLVEGYAVLKSAAAGDREALSVLSGNDDLAARFVELAETLTKAEVIGALPQDQREAAAALIGKVLDGVEKAEWSSADMNDLPDSAFAYVEPGDKDAAGKTAPRSKRHFPIKNAAGDLDAAHVRNALGRLDQSPHGDKARGSVESAAKKMGIGDTNMTKALLPADRWEQLDLARKALEEVPVPETAEEQLAKATARIADLEKQLDAKTEPPDPAAAAEAAVAKALKDNPDLQAVLKAKDDEIAKAQANADEAMRIAKAQEATHVETVFKALAKDLGGGVQMAEELCKAYSLSVEHGGEMERLYRQNAELARKSGLLKEFGSSADGDPASPGVRLKKAVADLMTAKPDMTREQAIVKACETDPELRTALSADLEGDR